MSNPYVSYVSTQDRLTTQQMDFFSSLPVDADVPLDQWLSTMEAELRKLLPAG
ncbi:MAG: hypothetical protein HY207_13685 [Nitrospirae bacterium]|nr:hypothetical protein [Nitrospirota bacterium]